VLFDEDWLFWTEICPITRTGRLIADDDLLRIALTPYLAQCRTAKTTGTPRYVRFIEHAAGLIRYLFDLESDPQVSGFRL